MARISIVTVGETREAVQPAPHTVGITSRSYFDSVHDPLHLCRYQLDPGAELEITGEPTEKLVYILEGAVTAGETQLAARSSMIIEYSATFRVFADTVGATLLVFSARERRPTDRAGGHVHLLPSEQVPRSAQFHGSEGIGGGLHADSACPTCQVWLHEQSYEDADKETELHSHSEDEIIFITGGEIRLGRQRLGPGTAIAIAANAKYSFFSGEGGLQFINFRGSSPTYTSARGDVVLDEAELWCSALGHPKYISPH